MATSHHHPEQDVEAGKFDPFGVEPSSDGTFALPEAYGDNRIVVMSRDPYWFFAYWEITPDRAEAMRMEHGRNCWDETVMTLRVYDLGENGDNSLSTCPFFDVDVHKFSRQGYVQVPHAGHSYVVDLGIRWPEGRFASLFRSNVIRQPVGRVSDRIDSQWMSVGLQMQEWERMAQSALGAGGSKGASGELTKGLELRWEYLRSIFSGSVSSWIHQEPRS